MTDYPEYAPTPTEYPETAPQAWNPAPTAAGTATAYGLAQDPEAWTPGEPAVIARGSRCRRGSPNHVWTCRHESLCECGEMIRVSQAATAVQDGL